MRHTVCVSHNDDAKGNMGFTDVTLAYDDDAKGTIGFRDVTLAFNNDTKRTIGSQLWLFQFDDGGLLF